MYWETGYGLKTNCQNCHLTLPVSSSPVIFILNHFTMVVFIQLWHQEKLYQYKLDFLGLTRIRIPGNWPQFLLSE